MSDAEHDLVNSRIRAAAEGMFEFSLALRDVTRAIEALREAIPPHVVVPSIVLPETEAIANGVSDGDMFEGARVVLARPIDGELVEAPERCTSAWEFDGVRRRCMRSFGHERSLGHKDGVGNVWWGDGSPRR